MKESINYKAFLCTGMVFKIKENYAFILVDIYAINKQSVRLTATFKIFISFSMRVMNVRGTGTLYGLDAQVICKGAESNSASPRSSVGQQYAVISVLRSRTKAYREH